MVTSALFCFCFTLALSAESALAFDASGTHVTAVRGDDGVRLDWRVLGGAESAPIWHAEVRAADAVWEAIGSETEFGRELDVVCYDATLPVPAGVETVEVFLWAESFQEKPAQGWVVQIAPAPPKIQARAKTLSILPSALVSGVGERVRLVIRKTGLYTVTAGEIAAALEDVDESTVRTWIAATNLAVTCMGIPIAWHVVGANDAIAFVGMAYHDLYTDSNVYWISLGAGLALAEETVVLPSEPVAEGTFWCETRFEEDLRLFELFPAEKPLDGWYWDSVDSAISQMVLLSFSTPDAVQTGQATMRLWACPVFSWQNASPHGSLTLSLSNQVVGAFPVSGGNPAVLTSTFDASWLNETNVLRVSIAPSNGVSRLRYLIDSVTLRYARAMRAQEGQLLLALDVDGQAVVAGGFASSNIAVYALSEGVAVSQLKGLAFSQTNAAWQCAFMAPPGGTQFLLTTEFRSPDVIEGVGPDPWAGTDHAVDYLVVSPEAFLPTLEPLLALRAEHLRVGVVTTESLYLHNNGGRFYPYALREMLHRSQTWQSPPKMVLLVGHGHYDYRGLFGSPVWQPNFIAPALINIPYDSSVSGHLLVAGDNDFADFNGDGLPELMLGRLPARTATELSRMVSKTLVYEANRASRTNVVNVADIETVEPLFTFHTTATTYNARLPTLLDRSFISARDIPAGQQIATIRTAWRERINAGVWMSAFFGHAGQWSLGNSPYYLDYKDPGNGLFTNQERPGLLLGTTCAMNSAFKPAAVTRQTDAACVGAEVLRGTLGGMVATLAPSSPSYETPGSTIANAFADAITVKRRRYLGEGVRDGLTALRESNGPFPFLSRTFVLLGDPALDLRPAAKVFPWSGTLLLLHGPAY